MAYHITLTITPEQRDFITAHSISPSAIMQQKIDEIMKIKDPELFQQIIKTNSKDDDKRTEWQKALENEQDYNRRKIIQFNFMDSFGLDTSDWKERIEAEKAIKEGVEDI